MACTRREPLLWSLHLSYAFMALGHTGREIRTLPGIGGGLGVMFLAAALRSPIMEMLPQGGSWWAYDVSIFLWCAAYLAFLSHYEVPLLRTRADGKDG